MTGGLAALVFSLASCAPTLSRAGHTLPPDEQEEGAPPAASSLPAAGPLETASPGDSSSPPPPPPLDEPQARPEPAAPSAPEGPAPRSDGSVLELTLAGRGALEGFGPQGGWLAVCEERAGRVELHFAVRSRAASGGATSSAAASSTPTSGAAAGGAPASSVAQVVDAVLGWSLSGRYVVVEKEGRALLHDTEGGFELDLAPLEPSLERDELPEHRSFSFSSDERELAVLTRGDRRVRLVDLRGLDTKNAAARLGQARSFELSTPVWRVAFQEASLVLTHLPGDGSPRTWPVPRSSLPARRCALSTPRFSAYSALSEPNAAFKRRVSWIGPRRERVEEAPGFVFAFGAGWVRREADGRLLLVQGRVQKQIASSRCGARVLHADSERGLFLAACEEYSPVPPPPPAKKPGARRKPPSLRFPLYLLAPGYVKELELDAMRTGVDVPPAPRAPGERAPRFVPLRPGTETVLVDLEARRPLALQTDSFVLQTSGELALVRRGDKLFRSTGKNEEPLALPWQRLAPTWLSGSWLAQGEVLADWTRDRSFPLAQREPWALAPTGALVSATKKGESTVVRLEFVANAR